VNAPSDTSSEDPTTMRAAAKVLTRLAFKLATDLGATREQSEDAVRRVMELLDRAERDGVVPKAGKVPVVLLLASLMLDELAEGEG
jgi:hypothetical protein